jgi:hypothetical protein
MRHSLENPAQVYSVCGLFSSLQILPGFKPDISLNLQRWIQDNRGWVPPGLANTTAEKGDRAPRLTAKYRLGAGSPRAEQSETRHPNLEALAEVQAGLCKGIPTVTWISLASHCVEDAIDVRQLGKPEEKLRSVALRSFSSSECRWSRKD